MTHVYAYVIVRADLTHPQKVVQSAHAVMEACHYYKYPKGETSIIVLEVASKAELLEAHERLNHRGIDNYVFFEPDFEMGESALATRALYGSERNCMRKYRLLSKCEF